MHKLSILLVHKHAHTSYNLHQSWILIFYTGTESPEKLSHFNPSQDIANCNAHGYADTSYAEQILLLAYLIIVLQMSICLYI